MNLIDFLRYKRFLPAVLIFIITSSATVMAQTNEEIDATIELYPKTVKSPEALSKFISRDFKTEEAKVRAIYTWLIKNVAYDPKAYKLFNYFFTSYREGNSKEEKTREKLINYTLQTGNAVCEGYAMTFEKLCQLQGIKNYLVRGDTKTNFNDIGREYAYSHVWNVAIIDGASYLFDATWGAGRYTTKFIKDPSYYFYKIKPEFLINTHFPKEFEDTFLKEKIAASTFFDRPLLIKEGITIDAILSEEKKGVLKQQLYDGKINFKVAVSVTEVSYSFGNEKFTLEASQIEREGAITSFEIPLVLGVDKLLIYFDGKPALGYIVE